MNSFKRTPGGYIKTRNVSGGFEDSVQRTFGFENKLNAPFQSTSIKDQHTWGRPGGASGRYELHHTDINPYKGAALAVGAATAGYGARYVYTHRGKVNNSIGRAYHNHPVGMRRLHYGAAVTTGLYAPNQKALLGGVAANTAGFAYGLHQADLYKKSLR